jgi:hypothetical protein
MVRDVNAVAWYAAIAGALFLMSSFVLHRMAWPAALKARFATAAGIALAWPLALPMLSFGSVAIARLIQTKPGAPTREPEVPAVVPAA